MPQKFEYSMSRPGPILGLLFILAFTTAGYSQAEETIVVEGEPIRAERIKTSQVGQSILIQPEQASRFDASDHLRRESSLTFIESGRVSPSGFMVPRIRAQDSKLTDIYLEDILLSDPYSGLPLVEDLDLRAFGSLELHQGSSPASVPSGNSVGVLRYQFREARTSKTTLGLVTGSPYGLSLWSHSILKGQDKEFRLYGRAHQSSGRYSFYSDESTPYNSRDDKLKTRNNNDQRSEQIMPYYRQKLGAYTLKALAWKHRANRGIPSGSVILSSNARDISQGLLGDVSVSRSWFNLGLIDTTEVSIHLGRTDDERETLDPERLVLNSSTQAKMKIGSNRQGVRTRFGTDHTQTYLSLEGAQSKVGQSFNGISGMRLNRSNENAILGLAYLPSQAFTIEGKVSSHRQWDNVSRVNAIILAEEEPSGKRYRFARGETLTMGFGKDLGAYGQISRSRRLPSLYEEFGNGNTVRPNSDLKAESLFHRETGGFFQAREWRLSTAYYNDQTDEKIVVVPIMASASKALNVGKTSVQGLDAEVTWKFDQTLLSAKATWMSAEDLSRKEKRKLPSIPGKIMIGEWRQTWLPHLTSHLSARYRSQVYRDLGNTVTLPGMTSYDANLDLSWRGFEWGLAVRNLLNTRNLEISSGRNRGRTGVSDIAGSPLPGRQWVFNFVSTLE